MSEESTPATPTPTAYARARTDGALDSVVYWPAAERTPVTVLTEGRTWRDGPTTHPLEAVIPPLIAGHPMSIPADIGALVVEAERALAQLDAHLGAADAARAEAASFALLRSESLSSSRIEGINVTTRRLAEAIYDAGGAKQLAREVIGNIEAMSAAVDHGTATGMYSTTRRHRNTP